jgi:glycerate dehydrogenase
MKIVALDGYTLNPGDLSWDGIRALGDCVIYDRSAPEEVVARATGADVVLTNKTILSRETLSRLPGLKFISVLATGFNVVDVSAARERGIPVSNVPAYGTRAVAQMTMALLLELAQHAGHHARTAREGRWSKCPDYCYWDFPLLELDGLTMGIVGFGRIGRATADLATAFGMKVLACARTPPTTATGAGQFVSLEELLRRSDVVSLHCPLTPDTKQLINAVRLAWMKPAAILLNTSRGGLIDETALAAALNEGRIGAAALDVLSVEPPTAGNVLLGAKNCLVTPHIAWAARAARVRLLETTVENIKAFGRGAPQNVVN